MLSRSDILQSVQAILTDLGYGQADQITEETAITDLGIDSLDTVEILMAFEDQHDIELDEDSVVNLPTIAELVTYLETALAAN